MIDGGASVNIITENLKTKLGLPKPRLAPYNLIMVDQSMTRPLGIIKNLKIHIHGIPYIATFIVLKNTVIDFSYSMLLERPWFKDAKVTHDWGNNVITVQGNGIIKIILVNRKLGAKTKKPQVFVCYDLMERLTYEEENLIFETKPKLLSIGTIILLEKIILLLNVGVSEIRSTEEYDPKQRTLDQIVKLKDFFVKPKVSLEDKVYPKTYYHHS